MKFKIKETTPPKHGDRRTRRVFAWRKTRVGKYWVWLEYYEVREQFFQPRGGNAGWWSETERNVLVWMY